MRRVSGARHKDARKARTAAYPQTPSTQGGQRQKLTAAELLSLRQKMQSMFSKWPDAPNDIQFIGTQAQLEGVDAIIQAATGSGKTGIVAGPHAWVKGMYTIMVCPLQSLEDEMVKTFQADYGLRAIAIHSNNGGVRSDVIEKILDGQYDIIIVSPEMLQSRKFQDELLRNPAFASRVMSVVVDEAHCISHWGANFRKKFSTISIVRAFLPRGTPVIAVTATLTARVRRDIQSKLQFPKHGSLFVNAGNDRPNVAIVVRACHHPLNSYQDLAFVLPPLVKSADDIKKTWIYVDDIKVGNEIIAYLSNLLQQRSVFEALPSPLTYSSDSDGVAPAVGVPSTPRVGPEVIRPFNAVLSHEYRTAAMEKFKNGEIRVMVCTEAAGMGCNIPDIEVVVQWKLPATPSNFIQRAGRAARSPNAEGLAVLLVEPSAYTVDWCSSSKKPSQKRRKRTKAQKGRAAQPQCGEKAPVMPKSAKETAASKRYAVAHGSKRGGADRKDEVAPGPQPPLNLDADDEGLGVFVQSVTCRRKIWAAAFDNDVDTIVAHPHVSCCDICDPSLLDTTRPAPRRRNVRIETAESVNLPPKGLVDINVQDRLEEWREDVFTRCHRGSFLSPAAILDDDSIELIAALGPLSTAQLKLALEERWLWWDQHGAALKAFLDTLIVIYAPIPKKPRATRKKAAPIVPATPPSLSSAAPSNAPSTGGPVTVDQADRPGTNEDRPLRSAAAQTRTLSANCVAETEPSVPSRSQIAPLSNVPSPSAPSTSRPHYYPGYTSSLYSGLPATQPAPVGSHYPYASYYYGHPSHVHLATASAVAQPPMRPLTGVSPASVPPAVPAPSSTPANGGSPWPYYLQSSHYYMYPTNGNR